MFVFILYLILEVPKVESAIKLIIYLIYLEINFPLI